MLNHLLMTFANKTAKPLVLTDVGERVGASYLLTNTGTSRLRAGGPTVDGTSKEGWPWDPGVTFPLTINGSDTLYIAAEDPATAEVRGLGQDS